MNKITIGQLSQFQMDASLWLGADPQNPGQFRNKANAESPLGECIFRVMPQVEDALKDWIELGTKYNDEVNNLKATFAEKAIISENSSSPQHVATTYEYTGAQLAERNRNRKALFNKLVEDRKAIEITEAEIEPVYVKTVPTVQILPPHFTTSFRGIVIDTEHDHNKSTLHIAKK